MTRRMFIYRAAQKRYDQALAAMGRLPKRGLNQKQNISVIKRYKAAIRALESAAWALFQYDDVWM